MTAALRQFWTTRTPRQRAFLVASLLLLAAALYLWLLWSADRARSRLQIRVGTLQELALQVDRQAEEFEQMRALPGIAPPTGDLYSLVQARIATGSGLLSANARVEPLGKDRVTLELRLVSFAQWLDWVDGMAAQRVQLESCQIEALGTPGMVSVHASLVRSAAP